MGECKGSPSRTVKNHEINLTGAIPDEVMNSGNQEQPDSNALGNERPKNSAINRQNLKDTAFLDEFDIDYLDEHPNDQCTGKVTR